MGRFYILLAFVLGSVITASVMSSIAAPNSITGTAIYNNNSFDMVAVSSTPVVNYSLINEAFQNNKIETYTVDCKPNAYIINDTVTKYECKLFYEDRVDVRKISPTGSMWPNLVSGGYIIVSNVRDIDELYVGDIVIIEKNGDEFAHRIIEMSEDENGAYIITQGDNNHISDSAKFRECDVKSKVVGVLY